MHTVPVELVPPNNPPLVPPNPPKPVDEDVFVPPNIDWVVLAPNRPPPVFWPNNPPLVDVEPKPKIDNKLKSLSLGFRISRTIV